MALPCALGLGTLLALPGALGSGGSRASSGSSSVTVVLLLLLLLLLVTGLVLAWRRLSHDSGGYYHPAALWGRTCRLLWASPPGLWLRARAEPGSLDADPEEREEDEREAEDESAVGGNGGKAESKAEQQLCAQGPGPGQAPEQAEAAPGDDSSEGGLGLSPQGPAGSGGSAQALLSDLHAFAGSAAWDDGAGAAAGRGPHITAL
ncbi:protein tyrosine phosphatase receptor type C-associated protein [Echinops telfairi]|uniref:Protein tyrosine phosphatase receptor type C-associated protein n=1 Tax=Echinops telfairi TaxID=9371 RepID=A0AC55DNF3_ECHTE|nr:protein tyrosine phosphatase receptor type C-associated protein [Echinops telfairi]